MKWNLCILFFLTVILSAYPQTEITRLQKKIDSIDIAKRHIYQLGDYGTSLDFLEQAYELERSYFPEDHPVILQRLTTLAVESAQIKNIHVARNHINKALNYISENPKKYDSTYALVKFANARVLLAENKYDIAAKEYNLFFEHSKKNSKLKLSASYIDCLLSISYFHTQDNQTDLVGFYAKLAYSYSQHPKFKNSLIKLRALMHLAYYHFVYNQFRLEGDALKYTKAAKILSKKISEQSPANAIKTLRYQRQFKLWKAVSGYSSTKEPSVDSLLIWAQETGKAIESLIEEKKILKNSNNISLSFISAIDYFNFSKKLYWEHYRKTNSVQSVDALLSIHESYLYNKIRNRLKNRKIDFKKVPSHITEREDHLLQELFLKAENSTRYTIEHWNTFLDSLKMEYPKYHELKYGKVVQSIEGIQKTLPQETTLVRYFYIYKRLHAFVCSANEKAIVQLPYIDIDLYLDKYSNTENKETKLTLLHILHSKLWEPFAEKVQTKNVVIVPDDNLFNFSFELLTPNKVDSYAELASHSLLAKHTISYNYSSYLVEPDTKILDFDDDFVAYAPEFNKKMKKKYHLSISDSTQLDKNYLTLLQQPFSSRLVTKISKRFDGDSFLNEKASKQVFFQTAKEHKIIHIGTHAVANNENPELSRLVFAKNVSDSTIINDNYLYTYEIYNHNLSSKLAILTACETGKPGFQPGEGMISLAHAFNYAGSKSILTSLWEIDEESSTQIVSYFYEFLEKGLPKHEALQQAKLRYLDTSPKAALAPEYWAGLVLMGDTSPIALSGSTNWLLWVLAIGLLLLLGLLIRNRIRRS